MFVGRVTALAFSVVLAAVASLLFIYSVIANFGVATWGGVAVAQSIGLLLGVVVGLGWTVVGAAETSARVASGRGGYYLGSFVSRVHMFAVVGAVALPVAGIMLALTTKLWFAFLLIGITPTVVALGGPWFFIGEGRPWSSFLLDALPRALGVIGGAIAAHFGAPLWALGVAQLAGATTAATATLIVVRLRFRHAPIDWSVRHSAARIAAMWPAFVTGATASIYVNLPVMIVGVLSPASVPMYALGDRIKTYALMAQIPLAQFMQQHIPAVVQNRVRFWKRVRRSLFLVFLLATIFGALLYSLGPFAAMLLSGGAITFTPMYLIALAIAASCVVLSGVTGPACLVAVGRTKLVAMSTLAGAVVGLLSAFTLGHQFGATGVAFSVAFAEALVVFVQLVGIYLSWRSDPLRSASDAPR